MPGKPDNRPGDYRLKQSNKVANCGSFCTGRACRHARPHIELARPAKVKPYGMVISEAMAAQVPVAVSDACGAAAQVNAEAGEVVKLYMPVRQWVNAVSRQLARTQAPPSFVRVWDVVAREFAAIYNNVDKEVER